MITTVKLLELFYDVLRENEELEGEAILIELDKRIKEWKNENK